MSYNADLDFNNANEQLSGDFKPIPENTVVHLIMKVRPGGAGDGGMLTQSKRSPWQYLDCEFTVVGGRYDKRKIWQNMMWFNPSEPKSQAADITKQNIRAMLESARNVMPSDQCDEAKQKRRISSLSDLNGLSFTARVGIEKGTADYPDDKNTVKFIVTPDMSEYSGGAPTATAPAAPTPAAQPAPPAAEKPASAVPAWAQ
jgi:hypothetical protein